VTSIGASAFERCYSLTSIAIPTSTTSIGGNAFKGCSSITALLVHPSDANAADEDEAGVDSNPDAWSRLYAAYDTDDSDYEEEEYEQLLPDTTKIWAPDTIVAQLAGQFEAFARFADVPRAFRAAPDATTWAGAQLWLWWLPPSSFYSGGDGSDDGDDRVVCKSRVVTIWITMLSAYKSSEVLDVLPDLEPELWEHIFTFLKHDQQPAVTVQYRAICNCDFSRKRGDEMSIQLGEQLRVVEDFGDGWTKVVRLTGEDGIVPSDYIDILTPQPPTMLGATTESLYRHQDSDSESDSDSY